MPPPRGQALVCADADAGEGRSGRRYGAGAQRNPTRARPAGRCACRSAQGFRCHPQRRCAPDRRGSRGVRGTSTSNPRAMNSWAAFTPATRRPSTTTFCTIALPGPISAVRLPPRSARTREAATLARCPGGRNASNVVSVRSLTYDFWTTWARKFL